VNARRMEKIKGDIGIQANHQEEGEESTTDIIENISKVILLNQGQIQEKEVEERKTEEGLKEIVI